MPWKKIFCLALCAGLLCGVAACSEKVEIRTKGETAVGIGMESRK